MTTRPIVMMASMLLSPLLLSACGVMPADRQLLAQNVQAAEVVLEEADALSQVAEQAVQDIHKNSVQLQAALGKPEQAVTYSPEASERYRRESQEEHAAVRTARDWVAGKLPWLFGGGGILAAIGAWISRKRMLRWVLGRIEAAGPAGRIVKQLFRGEANPEVEKELKAMGLVGPKPRPEHDLADPTEDVT